MSKKILFLFALLLMFAGYVIFVLIVRARATDNYYETLQEEIVSHD